MSPLKVALGALAVIVVFVTGFAVLGRPSGLVGGVARANGLAVSVAHGLASPAPARRARLRAGPIACSRTCAEPLTVDADVPAGWRASKAGPSSAPADSGAPAGMGIAFVHADSICQRPVPSWDLAGNGVMAQPGDVAVGPTVDDLANALHANGGVHLATAPGRSRIGGSCRQAAGAPGAAGARPETAATRESGDPQGRLGRTSAAQNPA